MALLYLKESLMGKGDIGTLIGFLGILINIWFGIRQDGRK